MYFQTIPHRTGCNLVALLFICLHSLPASAQNESFKAAEKIPVTIHSVASGGYWSAGNDEGSFRAIVSAGGVEHVVHRLYIQWLKNDTNTQGYELVRTVNVKELNLGHGYVMSVKTSFGDINSFKIDVTANSRGGKRRHYAIIARRGREIYHSLKLFEIDRRQAHKPTLGITLRYGVEHAIDTPRSSCIFTI